MADTLLGYREDGICAECGERGTIAFHCGPLSPDGQWHHFCDDCWSARVKASHRGEAPKPLGWRGFPIPQD